jgi:hypothetical protein
VIVEILENIATPAKLFIQGQVYDLPQHFGQEWVSKGLAKPSTEIPHDIRAIFERLDLGAGKTAVFLPFVGEFGHLCMTHLRIVHFNRAARKIVCCRPGEEILFPSADEFCTDWTDPMTDLERVATMHAHSFPWNDILARYPQAIPIPSGRLTPEQELAVIHPEIRIPFRPTRRGLTADVLLGVRSRGLFPERNWKHWQALTNALRSHGITFAVLGADGTSHDLEGQVLRTGKDTSAAIELLQRPGTLYVGTDSGASHLASTVGTKMVLFREDKHRSRNLVPRMKLVNDRITFIENAWDDPDRVIDFVLNRYQHDRSQGNSASTTGPQRT